MPSAPISRLPTASTPGVPLFLSAKWAGVAGPQNLLTGGDGGAGPLVAELRHHAVRRLLPGVQVPAGDDALRPQAFARGLQQHHLQPAAVDGELRPAVAGGLAARLRPDELAALGVVGQLRGAHAQGVEPVEQAQLVQLAHRMGQQVDADAQRPDLRRGFEDRHRHPRLVERERQGEAADAGAGDQDRHALSPVMP